MLAEPQPTPYDLKFRLFRFPVRVHPMFWVVTVLMGRSALETDYPAGLLAVWVGVVFASILVHELGHALAYRYYGSDGRIWLYWFGGLAISEDRPQRPWRSIAVSLAGPAAGFLLAAVVYASNLQFGWESARFPYTDELYFQLLWVNVGWGLVNLLPVLPLDGGQACREVCRLAGARRPEVTALKISIGSAVAVALYSLMIDLDRPPGLIDRIPPWARIGSLYLTILFGFLAYSSYQTLQFLGRSYATWDDGDDAPPWRGRR